MQEPYGARTATFVFDIEKISFAIKNKASTGKGKTGNIF